MLHKEYEGKKEGPKKIERAPQRVWREDELIGGELAVVKALWL
jgi:hypothetical protein